MQTVLSAAKHASSAKLIGSKQRAGSDWLEQFIRSFEPVPK